MVIDMSAASTFLCPVCVCVCVCMKNGQILQHILSSHKQVRMDYNEMIGSKRARSCKNRSYSPNVQLVSVFVIVIIIVVVVAISIIILFYYYYFIIIYY